MKGLGSCHVGVQLAEVSLEFVNPMNFSYFLPFGLVKITLTFLLYLFGNCKKNTRLSYQKSQLPVVVSSQHNARKVDGKNHDNQWPQGTSNTVLSLSLLICLKITLSCLCAFT